MRPANLPITCWEKSRRDFVTLPVLLAILTDKVDDARMILLASQVGAAIFFKVRTGSLLLLLASHLLPHRVYTRLSGFTQIILFFCNCRFFSFQPLQLDEFKPRFYILEGRFRVGRFEPGVVRVCHKVGVW